MAEQLKEKLRLARAVVAGIGNTASSSSNTQFYDYDDTESENSPIEQIQKPRRSESPAQENVVEMLSKHRQLAQALMTLEGADDDDTVSIASTASGYDVAVLSQEGKVHYVKEPGETRRRASPESNGRSSTSSASVGGDFVDLAPDAASLVNLADYFSEAINDDITPWYQRFGTITLAWCVDLIDAFSETNDDIAVHEEPARPLNVKELRQNLRRCRSQARPYLETFAGIWDLIIWRNALSTLLLFWAYMFCVWRGYLITLLLFLLLLQLLINYLSYCCKVKLGLTLLPKKEINHEMIESPGAQLVLEVARYAQILLEFLAEALEKIKNLMKWKRPRTTATFSVLVFFWFVVSLFTSTSTFLTIVGFGAGIKLFVTSYLFYRFPRLRHKLDVFTWFLDRTPSDRTARRMTESDKKTEQTGTATDHTFAKSFALPVTEKLKIARNCALIDKEKSFPFNVGSGKLYLSSSHVLFKYSRWTSGLRQVIKIPFDNIIAIKKTKTLKFAAFGEGMALDVYVAGREKPYLFAGVVRRDEFYDTLMILGRAAGMQWAR